MIEVMVAAKPKCLWLYMHRTDTVEQRWSRIMITRTQNGKKIESSSSLAWTKHDKYMQQEHKLLVLY